MVSVIIPVYNAEQTIRQAIDSAWRTQHGVTTEVIVVDDGSTDQTPEILHELRSEAPIRLIRQHNEGPGVARNVALRQAQGEFVVFLDADDYLEPMALWSMRRSMLTHETDAVVAGTRQLLGKRTVGKGIECWNKPTKNVIDVLEGNFLVEIAPGVRAKMFRREILEGLTFSETKWEDLAFIPAALARAGRVAILRDSVYNYRVHLNTTVKDFLFRCKVEDVLRASEALEQNLQKMMDDSPKMQQAFYSILTLHTVFRMQNVLTWVDTNRSDKRQIIKALDEQLSERYPNWREDGVLCDPETSYKNAFFRMLLRRLDKHYLRPR